MGSSRVGLGTGERPEDGPDGRRGLGILPANGFVCWASSVSINLAGYHCPSTHIRSISGFGVVGTLRELFEDLRPISF